MIRNVLMINSGRKLINLKNSKKEEDVGCHSVKPCLLLSRPHLIEIAPIF